MKKNLLRYYCPRRSTAYRRQGQAAEHKSQMGCVRYESMTGFSLRSRHPLAFYRCRCAEAGSAA
jgi:hypothetical protein